MYFSKKILADFCSSSWRAVKFWLEPRHFTFEQLELHGAKINQRTRSSHRKTGSSQAKTSRAVARPTPKSNRTAKIVQIQAKNETSDSLPTTFIWLLSSRLNSEPTFAYSYFD